MAVLTPPGLSHSPHDELEPTPWSPCPSLLIPSFLPLSKATHSPLPSQVFPCLCQLPSSFVLTYSWDMSCGSVGASVVSSGEDPQLLFSCNLPLRCLPVCSMGSSSHTLLPIDSCWWYNGEHSWFSFVPHFTTDSPAQVTMCSGVAEINPLSGSQWITPSSLPSHRCDQYRVQGAESDAWGTGLSPTWARVQHELILWNVKQAPGFHDLSCCPDAGTSLAAASKLIHWASRQLKSPSCCHMEL